MTCNVAFIGLGVMGYPMAGYISKAGHNVTVFNRTKSKAEKWIGEYKGKMANTPADFIFTYVGNDNDLKFLLVKTVCLKLQNQVQYLLITQLYQLKFQEKFTKAAKEKDFLFRRSYLWRSIWG